MPLYPYPYPCHNCFPDATFILLILHFSWLLDYITTKYREYVLNQFQNAVIILHLIINDLDSCYGHDRSHAKVKGRVSLFKNVLKTDGCTDSQTDQADRFAFPANRLVSIAMSDRSRPRLMHRRSRSSDHICTSGQCRDPSDDTGTAAMYTRSDLLHSDTHTHTYLIHQTQVTHLLTRPVN